MGIGLGAASVGRSGAGAKRVAADATFGVADGCGVARATLSSTPWDTVGIGVVYVAVATAALPSTAAVGPLTPISTVAGAEGCTVAAGVGPDWQLAITTTANVAKIKKTRVVPTLHHPVTAGTPCRRHQLICQFILKTYTCYAASARDTLPLPIMPPAIVGTGAASGPSTPTGSARFGPEAGPTLSSWSGSGGRCTPPPWPLGWDPTCDITPPTSPWTTTATGPWCWRFSTTT